MALATLTGGATLGDEHRFAHAGKLWDALVACYREACWHELAGEHEAALRVLARKVKPLIEGWASCTRLPSPQKQALLREMFLDERLTTTRTLKAPRPEPAAIPAPPPPVPTPTPRREEFSANLDPRGGIAALIDAVQRQQRTR